MHEREARVDDDIHADDAGLNEAGEEAVIDDGEESAAGGDDPQRSDIEARARAAGWKPKDEWDGRPEGWTDAEEYLKRGDPRYLRKVVDKQSQTLKQLQQQRAMEAHEFEVRLARLDKMGQTALKRQREQIIAQTEAAKRQAAIEGDIEAYDAYSDQQRQVADHLAKEEQELAPPPVRQAQPQAPDPEIIAWKESNPAVWYQKDRWQAAVEFYSEAEEILDPNATVAEKLAFVSGRLNESFGEGTARMPNQRRVQQQRQPVANGRTNSPQRSPQVERGSRMATPAQPRGKGWNDIPAEDRAIIQRHVDEGLYDEDPRKHDVAKARAFAAKRYWS